MRRAPQLAVAALAAAAALLSFAGRELGTLTGVRLLQLQEDSAAGDAPLAEYRARGIELPRHGQQHLPWRGVRARFAGYVQLESAGPREWRLVSNGEAVLRLDGREVLARRAGAEAPSARAAVDLSAGSHAVEVDYASGEGPHVLRVLLGEPGGAPERLGAEQLFPEPPAQQALARVGRARALRAAGLALLITAGAIALAQLRRVPPRGLTRARHALPVLLAASVVVFAALLRLEALVHLQWQERAPPALRALAVAMWDFHPAGLRLTPGPPGYEGDPFTYLRFAREMRGFYDAHVREPVFVASARGFVDLLGGDEVGLALASAFYSTLLVAATYLLGASFFNPAVGLLAALPLALERQTVAFSALGWRDDAFAFFTALTLVALRRVLDKPAFVSALLLGLVAALACLTRITALAFVVPVLAAAGVLVRRAHARHAGPALLLAVGIFLAVLLPYLVTCWIAFGDPLISINAHTAFYRARAGQPGGAPMNAFRFLSHGRGPLELADTGLVGVSAYPFLNKWRDFDDWLPGASVVLGAASLLGLLGFCFVPRARLLLLALFASLVPYAFTWEVPGGAEWRFTLHAYPFYLVAAAWTLHAALRRAERPLLLRALAAGALALPLGWLFASGLHFLRVREELRAGRPAFVRAGPRDAFLLQKGWGRLQWFENGFMRTAGPAPAVLRLPLPPAGAYRATLRLRPLDACPRPCTVSLALDGRALGDASLEPTARQDEEGRFGSTVVVLETDGARQGGLLELRGGPVELWLLRLEPRAP